MNIPIETTEGPLRYPIDLQGGWALLFYYGGDFLPVSATELLGLAAMAHSFARQGCAILCISKDSIPAHLAFLETLHRYRLKEYPAPITFPLADDSEGRLEQLLHRPGDKKLLSLLAPGGEMAAQFFYPSEVGVNFTEAYRALMALQLDCPTPCGWVPGDYPLSLPPVTQAESRCFMSATEKAGGLAIDWYLSFDTAPKDPLSLPAD